MATRSLPTGNTSTPSFIGQHVRLHHQVLRLRTRSVQRQWQQDHVHSARAFAGVHFDMQLQLEQQQESAAEYRVVFLRNRAGAVRAGDGPHRRKLPLASLTSPSPLRRDRRPCFRKFLRNTPSKPAWESWLSSCGWGWALRVAFFRGPDGELIELLEDKTGYT